MSNTDNMRVLAVLSTQLLHETFVAPGRRGPVPGKPPRTTVAVDLATDEGDMR